MNKKTKTVRKDGKVFSCGRVYSEASYARFRRYQDEYARRKYRRFHIKFDRVADSELIAWVESQENLTNYVKKLVMADIKSGTNK